MVPRSVLSEPEWVRDYIGLPFKPGGRNRDGLDCAGLVKLVYRERFGIELPSDHPSWNARTPTAEIVRIIAEEQRKYIEIRRGAEACPDIVLLRIEGAEMHFGIVVARGKMIHAEAGADSSMARYTSPEWRNRVVGFFRYDDGATP